LLKKEARILGLSTARKGHKIFVFGVVFRGNLWLDGIVTCTIELNEPYHTAQISRTIIKSRQYSQLHAIILMKDRLVRGLEIDLSELTHKTKLPTIALVNPRSKRTPRQTRPTQGPTYYDILVNGKHVSVLTEGVNKDNAQQLLTIGCNRDNKIPEAVRVADLLAKEFQTPHFSITK
jgi:endonuclease V-like protein UPF0215 family